MPKMFNQLQILQEYLEKLGMKIEEAIELGLVDGLSTLIAAVIIISPFLFNLSITISYYISFLLSFMILFLTGMFLGKVSKENLFLSGAKLILVGVICTIIILLVERLG